MDFGDQAMATQFGNGARHALTASFGFGFRPGWGRIQVSLDIFVAEAVDEVIAAQGRLEEFNVGLADWLEARIAFVIHDPRPAQAIEFSDRLALRTGLGQSFQVARNWLEN